MTLSTFLTLFAACIGALGSIYVLKSYLGLTPALTADLATPRWGFSTSIIDSLSDQRAESIVGASAFVLALLLVIASIAFVPPSIALFGSGTVGVVAAAIGTATVIVLMHIARRLLASRHRRNTRRALLRNRLDSTLSEGRFSKAYVEALVSSARILIGLQLSVEAGPKHVCEAIATALDYTLPDGARIPAETTK